MALATWQQTNFLGGEWSPFYQGRAENPKYKSAMNVCRNGLPLEEGAWVRRPGSRLYAPTFRNRSGRIYPVEFSADQPYDVEFTDGNLRFFQGHRLVYTTDGAKTVSSVSTDNPAVLTLGSAVTWETDDEIYFFFDAAHPSGALPLRQRSFLVTKLTTTTFSLRDGLTGAAIDGSALAMPSGATVTAKRVLRVTSPYTSGSWANCRIVQNQDMGVVLNQAVAPHVLTITPGTTAGTATASLTAATFKDGPYLDPVKDSSGTASVLYWTGGTYSGPKRWGIEGTTANQGEVWANYNNVGIYFYWIFFTYIARLSASGGGGPLPSTTTSPPRDSDNEGWAPVDPGGVQAQITGTITVTAGFPQWRADVTYEPDNYTNDTNVSYHCTAENTGIEPGVTTGWESYWEVVDSGIAVTGAGKTPVGFQSSDVGRLIRFWSQPDDWSPTKLYLNGVAVTYKGSPYASTGVSDFRQPRAGINPETSFTEPHWGELSFDAFGNAQTGTPDYYGTTSTWFPGWAPIGMSGQWSWGRITQVNSSSEAVVEIDPDSAPIVAPLGNPPLRNFRMGAWSDTTSFPSCGSFYESRFWFGGAIANRFDTTQTFGWTAGSTVVEMGPTATIGDQKSGFTSDGTVTDACGITYTFESKDTNRVVWMEPDHNGLMCGTLGGEWLISASNLSDPITPTSIQAKRVTKYGCADIEPRRTGLSLVFVQKLKHRVMEFLSDVYTGRYVAPHLNEAAKHLSKNGVEELGYQEELAPIIWCRTGSAATTASNTDTLAPGATTSFRIWLYDDSCHQWTSNNQGASWTHRVTPGDDTWTDQSIAYIDGDFSSTAAVDDFGRVAVSLDGGQTWTTQIHAEVSTYPFNTAISGDAAKILLTTTDGYLYLSTDKGASFSAVATNLGNRKWAACCFNAGASIMYATSKDNYISKSVDGGTTWFDLTGGPQEMHTGFGLECVERIRCSADGQTVIYNCGYTGNVYVSRNAGSTWALVHSDSRPDAPGVPGDCGISYDGSALIFISSYSDGGGLHTLIKTSTDYGVTWTERIPNGYISSSLIPRTCNVSQDGTAFVVTYYIKDTLRQVDFSFDSAATWTRSSVPGDAFEWVNSFIYDVGFHPGLGAGPGTGPLIGATYRRVSSFTSESPAFVGWHRHDLGHGRILQSIGVSSDSGGLLDHLDMVTTDGTNYRVEGFTQIFDEDDEFSDAWFVDGGLVPDGAYEDTVDAATGIRFTGLWWLRDFVVTVFALGLDLGDYVVDANGTVFVPYGSGTVPASFDYSQAGQGAYLFTSAYIAANRSETDVRNGGVPYGGKFMPCCVGSPFVSDGQTLRPAAPEQVGTRAGPGMGQRRRSHAVNALLHNTLGISFGTDFGSTLQSAGLKDEAGNQPLPTQPFSGVLTETLNDDYTYDSMVSWRITRPYPASVVSIGTSVVGTDS